ncbi:MAG: stage II sporulation protein M [Lactobacillales bacterium]|jgi:uncharacterized membrane protein SpoIIM required for sporulation|nr:stage II sporulation protein M [Lactobacillales bacterium]
MNHLLYLYIIERERKKLNVTFSFLRLKERTIFLFILKIIPIIYLIFFYRILLVLVPAQKLFTSIFALVLCANLFQLTNDIKRIELEKGNYRFLPIKEKDLYRKLGVINYLSQIFFSFPYFLVGFLLQYFAGQSVLLLLQAVGWIFLSITCYYFFRLAFKRSLLGSFISNFLWKTAFLFLGFEGTSFLLKLIMISRTTYFAQKNFNLHFILSLQENIGKYFNKISIGEKVEKNIHILLSYQLFILVFLLCLTFMCFLIFISGNKLKESQFKGYFPKQLLSNTKVNFQFLNQKNFEEENEQLEMNGLNLLFSPELFLAIGVIFAVRNSIYNSLIWLTVLFFWLFVIHKGVISTVKGAFKNTFQYEYDLPKRAFFILYDVDVVEFCFSKINLFAKVTLFYALVNDLIFITISFFIHGSASLWIIPLFVIFLGFHKHLCALALYNETETFKILIRKRVFAGLERIREIPGIEIFQATNNIFSKLFVQLGIYILLFFSFIPLLTQKMWSVVLFAEIFLLLASIKIVKIKNRGDRKARVSDGIIWKRVRDSALISLLIFVFALILGVFLGNYIPFKLKINHFQIASLFLHNFVQGIRMILLGNLTFGVTNSLLLGMTGTAIGASTRSIYLNYGFQPILTAVFPHAFFEIVGMICMNILGYFSIFYLYFLKKSDHKEKFNAKGMLIIGSILFIAGTTLLLIAAIIEVKLSHT